jgi:putative transposase
VPRAKRNEVANGWYHVMNRGGGRRHVFVTDELKALFLETLGDTAIRYDLRVHAFCVMGNHYHLLINTMKPNLSSGMRFLNSRFAMGFNKIRRNDGPIFKSRFKSVFINTEAYLLNVSRYIHWNPVDARIVSNIQDYQWSSYTDNISGNIRYEWLETSLFADQETFVGFTNKGIDQRTAAFYEKQRQASTL